MAQAGKPSTQRVWTLERVLPWLLLIGGLIALASSFILTIERIDALKNPGMPAVCDLNPVFSCSTVTASSQASAFGFPNPLIGIWGFSVVATIGVAILAGAQLKRWFWLLVQAGVLFGVGFVTWLQYQSLYRIGALCLFCMIVWAMMIPMFWYVTLYNLRQGHIKMPRSLEKPAAFARKHHGDILLVWFILIIFLIGKRFWYYWSTFI